MFICKNKEYGIINIGMFNLVKGIAVIGILLEHTAYENFSFGLPPVSKYIIYSIHNALIPMFLIVSGYGFRRVRIQKGLKYQVDSLLIPFWFCGAATVLVSAIAWTCYEKELLLALKMASRYAGGVLMGLSYDMKLKNGVVFYGVGTVWYFLMLFLCWLLLELLVKKVKENWLPACIAILMLAGWGVGERLLLPFCILPTWIGVGYYYMGWQMKNRKWLQRRPGFFPAAAIVFLALSSGWIGRFNLATCEWTYGIPDIIAAGASGLLLVWIGVHVSAWEFPMKAAIQWVGRNSLWIMVLHTIEDHGIPWILLSEKMQQQGIDKLLILCFLVAAKTVIIAAGYWLVSPFRKSVSIEREK